MSAASLEALSRTFGGRQRLAAAIVVGLLAGFLSGLFGVGGGILIVPSLVIIMKMSQRMAHGTSLAAIIPIATSGVIGFAVRDSVDWPAAAFIILGASAGAVLGVQALHRIPQRALALIFGTFLVLAAIRLLINLPEATGREEIDVAMALGFVALGAVSGTLAGLLGVGGGIVIVPAVVLLYSVPDAIAKGTSLLVIIPTAIVGTMRNVGRDNADLPVAAVVGVLGMGSAYAGSQIAVELDPRLSARLFAGLLLAVTLRLLLQQRGSHPAEDSRESPSYE